MNIKFPSSADKDPERKQTGRWIEYIRTKYRKGRLSKYWVNQFEQTFPEWSWNPVDERVLENKKELLKMARTGKPRPSKKIRLGNILSGYICKVSSNYDSEFDKKIRSLAPHWFISTADENKKKLLELARTGKPRPVQKTQLGRLLCNYTNNHDSKFDRKIRSLAPQWFINTADEKKKQLLDMARKKESKPSHGTQLAQALTHYIGKRSDTYDVEFDKAIRKLTPHWFKTKRKAG